MASNFHIATAAAIIHFASIGRFKFAKISSSVIARFSKFSRFWMLTLLPLADLAAQIPRATVRPSNTRLPPNMRLRPPVIVSPARPMKPATELINRQEPMNVTARLLDKATPDNTHVRVSLSKQRAYLMIGDEVVIDTPISSGKRSRITPSGSFHVQEKDKDHRSNIYGNFVDSSGRVVRSGVSSKIDSAPSGTHFVGAPMTWFMRLTDEGVGMHVGILPGYPASHGCIRMPPQAAEMFYNRVKVGTSVVVGE
jgi:lipoprotein-anchoring transpeptidase ErfK/SrfK